MSEYDDVLSIRNERAVNHPSGFVYVQINDAMPGMVKIGETHLSPRVRTGDLDNTSVPIPFELVAAFFVTDRKNAERIVHDSLAGKRVRGSREFFWGEPSGIVKDAFVAISKAGLLDSVCLPDNTILEELREVQKINIELWGEINNMRAESISMKRQLEIYKVMAEENKQALEKNTRDWRERFSELLTVVQELRKSDLANKYIELKNLCDMQRSQLLVLSSVKHTGGKGV